MPSEWQCSPSKAYSEGHLLWEQGVMPSEWECSPSKANSKGHLLWERGVMPSKWGVPQVSRQV
jgi:hypothetical protein